MRELCTGAPAKPPLTTVGVVSNAHNRMGEKIKFANLERHYVSLLHVSHTAGSAVRQIQFWYDAGDTQRGMSQTLLVLRSDHECESTGSLLCRS